MLTRVFGFLCLLAVSFALPLLHNYVPTYHQQPITYIQDAALYPTVTTRFAQVAAISPVKAIIPTPHQIEYSSEPARYDFFYGVHDSLTGDIKSQTESRDGSNVHGSYSLIDSDGFKRTVTYTADDVNGFNAVVRREPLVGIASPIVIPQAPGSQYLPAAQIPTVPVVAEDQPNNENADKPVQQPVEEINEQEDNDITQDVPQSDDDSDVVSAFGAAARTATESSNTDKLNEGEVAPLKNKK